MSEREELYQAIVDAPDDAAPQLVFADWLEENGEEERARHIRHGIARHQQPPYHPRSFILSHRSCPDRVEMDFLSGRRGGKTWDVGSIHQFDIPRCLWVRDLTEFLAEADEAFRVGPIRALLCSRVGSDADAVVALPQLRQIRYLHTILDEPDPVGWPRLLRAPSLAGLKGMWLQIVSHLDEWVTILTGPTDWRPVTVNAPFSGLTGAHLERLLRSPLFAEVRDLDLTEHRSGPAVVDILACTGVLRRLTDLKLSGTDLGAEGTARLAAEDAPPLEALDLHKTGLRCEAFGRLAGWTGLAGVRRLSLTQNELGDDEASALARHARFNRLEMLDLGVNTIGPRGVAELVRAPWLTGIVRLDLSSNPLGDEGAKVLASSPAISGLGVLILENCDLTAEGVGALLRSKHIRDIPVLDLSCNHARSGVAEAVLQSPHLDRIQFLDLSSNSVPKDEQRAIREKLGARVYV